MEGLSNVASDKELYGIQTWGQEYFSINHEGEVCVNAGETISLYSLIESAKKRGVSPPFILKFDGIIEGRVRKLYGAFEEAIEENGYENVYKLAYPIKVNPTKEAVLSVQKGSFNDAGLEVGSKAELLAALTASTKESSFILCNGYKDAEYIEIALQGKAKGYHLLLVIEKISELDLILQVSEKLQVEPEIGFRFKLSVMGKGKWSSSGGDFSKFGLSSIEAVEGIRKLQELGKESLLTLLHFHIGSQIASLECVTKALQESAKIYVEVARLCPSVQFFDIGGGLAIDYDGTCSSKESSSSYTLKEYAGVVVETLKKASKEAKLSPPVIITESGRALMAHHAVFVTEVVEANYKWNLPVSLEPTESIFQRRLLSLYSALNKETCQQVFYEATSIRRQAHMAFLRGDSSLTEKGEVDAAYMELISKVLLIAKEVEDLPKELEEMKKQFLDVYLCNFSVFQSLPDVWAIDQVFPVMPIHRLYEETKGRAMLVDLSCDSDGKIDHFVLDKGVSYYLPLHSLNDNPYYIGIFLTGAYQEILGAHHNLFGKTGVIHVSPNGSQRITDGDTVSDMLNDMGYEAREFQASLEGATYLI